MKNTIIISVLLLTLCYSCKPPARESDPLPDLHAKGIYIVNEGNFQWGNGSVSFYNIDSSIVTRDLFGLRNNTTAGDVCQSLYFNKDHFYLVVNNSNKIEVLDSTFVRRATITGLNSPRYIAFGSNDKGYVSDLYANGVSVFSTNNNTVEKKIPIAYWTEELLAYKDTIYVTSPASKYLYLIHSGSDQLVDSIDIGYGSSSLVKDRNDHLWILTSGKKELNIKPSLLAIDLFSRKMLLTYVFDNADAYPSRLNYSTKDQYVYWLDAGVKRFYTENLSGASELLIAPEGRNLYGLTIHPNTGAIIVSDAGDYVQRSTIYIYSPDGRQQSSFTAGIISGYMLVK